MHEIHWPQTTTMTVTTRLAELEAGTTTTNALVYFDSLPPIRAEALRGRFKGRELNTGHRLHGALAAAGWYGKQFDDDENVHPLLMQAGDKIFPLDPRKVPLGVAEKMPAPVVAAGRKLMGLVEPIVGTDKPRARLRNIEHRGVVTAAMIYDHLPIIDVFRRVDATTVLGLMDLRGEAEPMFFVLTLT